MENVNFKINGEDGHQPFNAVELAIDATFDRGNPRAQLSSNSWRFVNKSAEKILGLVNSGLTGGVGIFEAPTFDITIENETGAFTISHYLDLTTLRVDDCNDLTVDSKPVGDIDFLNERADSFTYEYLYEETSLLNDSDFVFVPYVISAIPNYRDAFIAVLTGFVVVKEIDSAIEKIEETVAEVAGIMDAIGAILKVVVFVAYLILLIIALVKLIQNMVNLLIQKVKYHAGMYVKDLLRIGAEHLGLTFESTIFLEDTWSRMVLIPRKLNNTKTAYTNEQYTTFGFESPNATQRGYFQGTFGELLRAMKDTFNAKIIISNGKLIFERLDFISPSGTYVVPDVNQPEYTYNTDELEATYLISFATDTNDRNTIQEYQGTSYQVTTRPNLLTDEKLVLTKGLKRVDIPFAFCKRKEDLTEVEKIAKAFIEAIQAGYSVLRVAVNGIIIVANGILDFAGVVIDIINFFSSKKIPTPAPISPLPADPGLDDFLDDRLGMWKVENDIINVQRLAIIKEATNPRQTDIDPNNATLLSAKALWEKFHVINSFVPSTARPQGNQWIQKRASGVRFCYADLQKIQANSSIIDSEGNSGEVISLKWNVIGQKAEEIVFRINKTYTTNLKEIKHEPTGR